MLFRIESKQVLLKGKPRNSHTNISCSAAHFSQLHPGSRQSDMCLYCVPFLGVPDLQWAGKCYTCLGISQFHNSSFLKYILVCSTGPGFVCQGIYSRDKLCTDMDLVKYLLFKHF